MNATAPNEQHPQTQEQAVQIVPRPPNTTFTGMQLIGGAIQPKSMGELLEFAKMVAGSGMVPKDYVGNPGAVLVAMQMGAELGLTAMASLQNICVVNGRPSVWGDAGLAIVKTHKDFVKIEEREMEEIIAKKEARCVLSRRNQPDVIRTFSKADAEQANLWTKKGPWSEYPQRMLQMRARWWAMRDQFPDALRGIQSAEESQDISAPWPAPIGAVAPLPDEPEIVPLEVVGPMLPEMVEALHAFESIGVSKAMLERHIGLPLEKLDGFEVGRLRKVFGEVRQNPKRKAELFGVAPSATAALNAKFAAPKHAPDPEVDEQALADGAAQAERASEQEEG